MLLRNVIEAHVDEAIFLFGQRQRALGSLHRGLRDLAAWDERLLAHLDGLLVGGDEAWELCRPLVASASPEEAFVAALVAAESASEERLAELFEALPDTPPEALPGVPWGLGLGGGPRTADLLAGRLPALPERSRAVALDALTLRSRDPGAALREALGSVHPDLAGAGARGAARLRLRSELPRVVALLDRDEPGVAAPALLAFALLDGPAAARARSAAVAAAGGPASAEALRLLGLLGLLGSGGEGLEVLLGAASGAGAPARTALLALGNLGLPETVPVLLEALRRAGSCRVAGAALRRLLGPGAAWQREEPPPVGPGDDDERPWSPDEDLPRWSAQALGAWWDANASRLPRGVRLRGGAPLCPGPPRPESALAWRHDEALEEAFAFPGVLPRQTWDLAPRQGGYAGAGRA